MTEKKHGLEYSILPVDEGHMINIDMMASDNPAIAATARLAQGLVNVIDTWMSEEHGRLTQPTDVMIATMHGVTTVCGSILLQVKPSDRKRVSRLMRDELLSIYDAMSKIVLSERAK